MIDQIVVHGVNPEHRTENGPLPHEIEAFLTEQGGEILLVEEIEVPGDMIAAPVPPPEQRPVPAHSVGRFDREDTTGLQETPDFLDRPPGRASVLEDLVHQDQIEAPTPCREVDRLEVAVHDLVSLRSAIRVPPRPLLHAADPAPPVASPHDDVEEPPIAAADVEDVAGSPAQEGGVRDGLAPFQAVPNRLHEAILSRGLVERVIVRRV